MCFTLTNVMAGPVPRIGDNMKPELRTNLRPELRTLLDFAASRRELTAKNLCSIDFNGRAEQFLAQHLGGRAEPFEKPEGATATFPLEERKAKV